MRSGPPRVTKGVDGQAGGQAATAGSRLSRPRCGGQARGPQEISEHTKGLGFYRNKTVVNGNTCPCQGGDRCSSFLTPLSSLFYAASGVKCQFQMASSEACRWEAASDSQPRWGTRQLSRDSASPGHACLHRREGPGEGYFGAANPSPDSCLSLLACTMIINAILLPLSQ